MRLLATLLLVLLTAATEVRAEARVALVIGNAAYREQPLKNPVNDARLMAQNLRRFGFDVTLRENASRDQIGQALRDFTRKLTAGAVSLIYYAGHGIQSRGRNYLIPVDALLDQESDLRFQAVDIGALLEEVELAQPRVSLVILDACRNNPFERKMRGGAGRGLTAVDAARGGLIAYATAPGSVAADGEGANGPYTEELVKAMAVPGLKIEEVFKRVTDQVEKRTGGQQTPWISSSLRGDLVINITVSVAAPSAPAAAAPATTSQGGGSETEMLFWRSAQQSNRVEEYRAYLQQFPQGVFANLARLRVAELEKGPSVAAAPAPAPPATPPATPLAVPPPAQPGSPQVGLIPPRPVEGNYKVTGTNPNGTPYSGSVRIARQGGVYEFNWNVGSVYRGVGGFQGDQLVIDWGQSSPAIYRVAPDGKLYGTWANGQGSEVLERY